MSSGKTVWKPIPVALDEDLERQVERIATARGEKKSAVMRAAIRAGLPLVESGSRGESLPLDDETSRDTDKVASEFRLNRERVLLDAIKIGLPALYARLHRKSAMAAEKSDPEKIANFWEHVLAHDLDANPSRREFAEVMRTLKRNTNILSDLLEHTPGPAVRWNNMVYLAALRARPSNVAKTGLFNGGGLPLGLTNEEIRQQIEEHEAELTPEEKASFCPYLDEITRMFTIQKKTPQSSTSSKTEPSKTRVLKRVKP